MVWSTIFRADAAQDADEPAPAPWLAPALQPSTLAALVALRHAALFRFLTTSRLSDPIHTTDLTLSNPIHTTDRDT